MTPTAKALAMTIGRRGTWEAAPGLQLRVVVLDVRQVFGRLDYQIRSTSDGGQAWVAADKVRLETQS